MSESVHVVKVVVMAGQDRRNQKHHLQLQLLKIEPAEKVC